MNHAHRIGRRLAGLTRRASFLPASDAAEPGVAATQPGPPSWTTRSPLPAPARTVTTPRARARSQAPPRRLRLLAPPRRLRRLVTPAWLLVTPAWRPHAVQLCIHCRENPAGFWVSRTGDATVRRPWCLSCCQELDRDRCDMIPFGG